MLAHIRHSSDFTEGAYFAWDVGWALDMHCHLIFTAAIISILQREEETEEAHGGSAAGSGLSEAEARFLITALYCFKKQPSKNHPSTEDKGRMILQKDAEEQG